MVELIKRELYIDAGQKGPAESLIEGFRFSITDCGWIPGKKKGCRSISSTSYRLIKKNRIKKKVLRSDRTTIWMGNVAFFQTYICRWRAGEWAVPRRTKKTFSSDSLSATPVYIFCKILFSFFLPHLGFPPNPFTPSPCEWCRSINSLVGAPFYVFALVTGGTASSFFFILGAVFLFTKRNHSLNTHTHTHKGEKSAELLYPNSTARRPIKTRRRRKKESNESWCVDVVRLSALFSLLPSNSFLESCCATQVGWRQASAPL